jgi:hypothetical protein
MQSGWFGWFDRNRTGILCPRLSRSAQTLGVLGLFHLRNGFVRQCEERSQFVNQPKANDDLHEVLQRTSPPIFKQFDRAEAPSFLAAPVPEPSSWPMMFAGVALLAGMARRRAVRKA